MPLFAGMLPSKFGLGTSMIGIMIIVFTGHSLQFLSIYISSYYMLLVSRILVGIGFVNYTTLNIVLITHWFMGKELGLCNSIQMMAGKLSVAVAGYFFSFWQNPGDNHKLY